MTRQTNYSSQRLMALLFSILGIALLLAVNPAYASTDSACTDTYSTVDSETTLNDAIACYNNMVGGSHQINIAADITLSAATTSIDNSEGSVLTIVGNGYTLDGADSYQPLNIQSGDVTIENVTLTRGVGTSERCQGGVCGGGLWIETDAVVTLDNSTVSESTAKRGGGIYNLGTLTITNSAILSNTGTWEGGGIFDKGMLVIEDSTIAYNTTHEYGYGGGLSAIGSSATLHNTTIVRNSANYYAGFVALAAVTMTDSTVAENSAFAGYGGLYGADLQIDNSTIRDNIAPFAAGVSIKNGEIANSLIENNQATSSAGGLLFWQGSATVRNTQILNNSAETAAGIHTYLADARVQDSTIAYNTATSTGGGIQIYGSSQMTVSQSAIIFNSADSDAGGIYVESGERLWLENSTVSGNQLVGTSYDEKGAGLKIEGDATMVNSTIVNNAGVNPEVTIGINIGDEGTATFSGSIVASNGRRNCAGGGTLISADYNLEDSIHCGFDGTNDLDNTDPQLATLADNGGATWTHLPADSSPVVNAAGNCGMTIDQRGEPRVGLCDIGAVELTPVTSDYFPATPLAYFSLDEGSATEYADELSTLTIVNSGHLAGAGGVIGEGITNPAGTNDAKLTATFTNADWLHDNQVTFSAWIMPSQMHDTHVVLVRQFSTGQAFNLRIKQNTLTPQLIGKSCDGKWPSVLGSEDVQLDEWNHLVGTYDGTTAKLYRNGVLIGSKSIEFCAGTSNDMTLIVGHRLQGQLDEVSVFDQVLTDEQVQALYDLPNTIGAESY